MIVIVCVDDRGGMMFNHRRQSADKILRDRILELTAGRKLWMNHYSASQFADVENPSLNIDDSFLSEAQEGEYCFAEDTALKPYEQWIEKIILFKWNRVYPSDRSFDISLKNGGWKLRSREDFSGNSHEKITMEVYER